jgi:HAD superfamily hydrolase (TIGR01509 family)
MFEGIAFDLEGTLIDIEWAHWQAHLEAAASFGLHLSLEEAIGTIPSFVGGPDEAIADEIARLAPTRPTQAEVQAVDRQRFRMLLNNCSNISLRPGLLKILRWLEARNIGMAIGSLTERWLADLLLYATGLRAFIPHVRIVLREDVASLKPNPEVYLATATRLGVAASRQLVFEDSVNGVKAARAAGSQVIAMPVTTASEYHQRLKHAGAMTLFPTWENIELRELLHRLIVNA